MHDLTIRMAGDSDAEALASLAGELGYPSTAEQMAGRLRTFTEDVVLVAETDRVIGWIQLGIVHSLESGSFAEIRGLVVTESLRGGGIGSRLVVAGEEWAREKGLNRMRVRSNVVRERTHIFYSQRGYRTVKAQKVFDKHL